ncbi:hypothetical protein KC717_00420 [Candidatus Dojkabacteria bacterium]|uniref:Thymidylate kinase n=1 Tax=Candidatus Dojkabacteria bacterium TaxID=2099670 RepID=A0A955RJU0_9BACT|nr:hypothetical protein [Candidatus Dojkabacteria bacterium]
MTQKGKFIIIEGTDGSGKTTQLEELKDYLETQGTTVKVIDFPQYEEFWGSMVGRFLSGEFGKLEDVNPYIIAPAYMLDQATQSKNIIEWINKGYIVLSNRYVTSSMAHQTCKFSNTEEQNKFLSWLTEAAYNHIGLIKEDITIVLSADPKISKELAQQSKHRKTNYTRGIDIAEDHESHISDSAHMYKSLCERFDTWHLIDCMNDSKIDSIENIHKKIVALITDIL